MGRGDRHGRPADARDPADGTASGAIGGITSSRCTNEEVYVVQKMVRAAFGNNNVDTCARVCHSPTGYGLKQTFGTSAGTQDFRSVDAGRRDHGDRRQPDRRAPGVRLADEAAAARGRQADRRRPAPHRPGALAAHRGGITTSSSRPAPTSRSSTRWRTSSSPRAWSTETFVARAVRGLRRVGGVHRAPGEQPGGDCEPITGVPAAELRAAARLYATGAERARSTTASASPSTARARRW